MNYLKNSILQISFFIFFLLIFAAPVFTAGSPVDFFGARAFGNGGTYYHGIIDGDFNGDGKIDVLTASYNKILVFFGDGSGGFSTPPVTVYSASGVDIFAFAGDFNNDGRSDVVFPLRNPANNMPSVAVSLGNADRTFSALTFSAQDPVPGWMVPVDFDNDGKLDLLGQGIVSNANAIVFYKGGGNGTFTIGGHLKTIYGAGDIAIGDFNNDSLPDISYMDSWDLKVSQNLGGGAFGAPVTVDSIDYGFSTSLIGDINNDGKNDVVAVQNSSFDPTVAVWLGNENFTFTQSPDFTISSMMNVYIQEITDVDKDHKQDLIFNSMNRTLVSKGLGNGTFAEVDSYVDGGGGGGLAVKDLNADGWLDIVATQSVEFAVSGSGSFSVLLNLGNGRFRSAPTFETNFETKDIAVADFNGDKLKDFIVVNRAGGGGPGEIIIVTQTNGVNRAEKIHSVGEKLQGDTGLDPYSVITGDFNQDNKIDAVVVGHGAFGATPNALMIINQDNNNFDPRLFQIGTGDIYYVAASDFNFDGKLDLVTTGYQGVSISFGIGNGAFTAPVSYLTNIPSSQIAIGDFNNDAKTDIAVVNYTTNKIGILTNNGAGTFNNNSNAAIPAGLTAIAASDMNSDGKLDLVVSKSNGVSIMMGSGDGTFNTENSYSITPVSASDLSLADFNGDGKTDVALLAGTNSVSLLLNNGAGGLGNETLWSGGAVLTTIAADDLDNDEKVDLIFGFTTSSKGYVKLLLNITERQTIQRSVLFDFDADGKADVSVFRPLNGAWYLLNSSSGFAALQFGGATDKLTPADFDGDGKTDIAIFRDGNWFLQRSRDGFLGIGFGLSTDVPMPADFDGDGKSEIAVFRPSDGGWYIYNLVNNQFNGIQFGQAGDIPVAGDYDGDGKADVAVFRSGTWYVQKSRDGFTATAFGQSEDKPVVADYDGDSKSDIAVFRPSNGVWYLLQSTDGFAGIQFGFGTDLPVPADYDGDGRADVAVFRDGNWYLQQSSQGFTATQFGALTDKPIPGAFVP